MCTKRSSLRLLCYCAGWEAEPWYWAVWEQLAARNNSFLCCVEKPPTVVVVCIWCSLTGACCSKLSSDKLHWETWTMQDYGNTHTHWHSHTFRANRLSRALGFGGWGRGGGVTLCCISVFCRITTLIGVCTGPKLNLKSTNLKMAMWHERKEQTSWNVFIAAILQGVLNQQPKHLLFHLLTCGYFTEGAWDLERH